MVPLPGRVACRFICHIHNTCIRHLNRSQAILVMFERMVSAESQRASRLSSACCREGPPPPSAVGRRSIFDYLSTYLGAITPYIHLHICTCTLIHICTSIRTQTHTHVYMYTCTILLYLYFYDYLYIIVLYLFPICTYSVLSVLCIRCTRPMAALLIYCCICIKGRYITVTIVVFEIISMHCAAFFKSFASKLHKRTISIFCHDELFAVCLVCLLETGIKCICGKWDDIIEFHFRGPSHAIVRVGTVHFSRECFCKVSCCSELNCRFTLKVRKCERSKDLLGS